MPLVSVSCVRATPATSCQTLDAESREWLARLRSTGSERDQAVAELHALLLRAARFEVAPAAPRRPTPTTSPTRAPTTRSWPCSRKLDDFRGDSRFTTWAYKFALLEAGVRTRRRLWQERQVPLDSERWELIADPSARTRRGRGDGRAARRGAQLAIEQELTPHQREVLVAITLNDVPIDVLAERLDTTRGAVYKTLHDARQQAAPAPGRGGPPQP